MADGEGEKEQNKKERPCIIKTETSFSLDNFHLTLNELESELRRQGLSEFSSNEYCNRFCQALVQYAGSRNTQEHGAALLEVYRISIERFAVARPYLTTDCENVLLVVKRLALSCFELLLSLPDTELTRECWLCLHQSLQKAHATLAEYGNNDLLALLEITGAGGSWNNSVLVRILAQMPYEQEEANAWITQEGPSFLELRVKHLIKIGTIPQAVLLAKLCSESDFIPQKSMFRQTYISLLCSMLPSEDAISEISSIDCKEVLDIICNLEAEGQENTAFVLCTTYLTQQLQKESICFSWELTLFWSKLQRRIDSSLDSFLERCRQFGSIAKTAYHLLFLVKVIQSEAEELGLAVSIELCVRAFQIPSQDDAETRSSLCKIVACLLSEDLEVRRVCQLTQFLLGPTQEAYDLLQELYLKPDQKYDEENCIIPNSLRCELLLALKALWPFDPEFWDWKTLKRHCQKLLGVDPSDESEPEETSETEHHLLSGSNTHVDISHSGESFLSDQQQQLDYYEEGRVEKQQQQQQQQKKDDLALKKKKPVGTSERYQRWLQYKFLCVICSREVIEARILHHSKMHMVDGIFTCPVCLQKFEGKQAFMPHLAEHIRMPSRKNHRPQKKKKKKKIVKKLDDDDDDDDLDLEDGNLEPGDVRLDPNAPENCQNTLGLDPVLQTLTPRKLDESDHITFSYIDANFELRDRDIYPCPATDCVRIFKHFKYLSIHIKSEHSETDENIKHYMEMKDRRQKCTFCRRHFLTPFHHRQHRRVHYGPQPYMCVAVDCDARFSSTNELVSHKQSHGYQLSYQCELKGCSLKFSDLGQLYHHEAQHFRDAAYNCMQPGCKKFYFSKKEFAKHLSTHGISFTDEDLVAASKNKPALFGLVGDFPEVGAEGKSVEISAPQPESVNGPKSILEELINGIKKESAEISQLANSPASQTSSTGSNLTGTLTSVAVCFDGKTFTCGFEGCGLTFAVAKDIQKHLKLAHPLQFRKKGESSKNLCRGKIAARRVQHMKPPIINQQTLGGQSSSLPSNVSGQVTSFSPQMNSVNPLSPHPSTSNEESLMEILIALSRLSLNTSNAASTSVLTSLPFSGSNVQVSSPFFTGASSPAKVIDRKTLFKSHRSNKPQQLRVPAVDGGLVSPSSFLSQLPEEEHKQLSQFLVQPNTKPYFCELKDCKFRSVTRSALLVHYLKKHNLPKEKVVGMKMFHSKFRPFKCHLCPRCFTRKSQLRVHLMDKHDLSKSLVAQMSCSEKRRAREEANMVRKPSGCLDLQGNATEKTEQQPPASVQSQGSVGHNRWPWITKSEWDNSIQGEDEEEDEDEEDDEEDDGEAEEDEDETDGTGKPSISEDNGEESHEGRGSRRLVAKSNLCYILTKYHKPFHCVHKDCSSAFTNQNGLIRHLQSVHRYNRNQLSLEEDLQQIEGNKKDLAKHKGRPCKHKACDKRFHTDESLSAENLQLQNLDQDLPALKAPGLQTPASEEPIPQFNCSYTNCSASYHLYSSLLRHIRLFHKGQFTKPNDPRSHHRCTFDGCARVFSNADNLKQHIFFRHWEHYDSFVFGLKNKKESNEKNNVQNFQKKPPEIGVPQTRTPKGETHSNQSVIQMPKVRTSSLVMASRRVKRRRKETLLFRTPEEALQMCQDRCFSVAFPCMVQDCESVVTLESSLIRHYKRCHDMLPSYIAGKYKDLVNNAEKLEEIIQNKSAASAVSSNEVCTSALADGEEEKKTLETSPLGPELQVCLSPIKPKPDEEVDHLDFEGDVPSNKLLIDADALLYGEVVKNGCMSEEVNRNVHEPDKSKPDPLSSTPTALFYKKDEGFVDFANTGTVSCSTPSRPPLKRKNEQEDPNFSPSIENQQCHLSNNRGSQPKSFDLKAYKPMGFESSFLKFIQESNDKDDDYEETSQWDPCLSDAQLVTKRKDSYRRACSVKENNQTGMGLARGKTASLVHGKLTDFQPMLSAEESATVQNLKSILDKALTDCGDLALKQLHYLKPVVVLERPKFPKSLLDLLPTKKNSEFCVGSS